MKTACVAKQLPLQNLHENDKYTKLVVDSLT